MGTVPEILKFQQPNVECSHTETLGHLNWSKYKKKFELVSDSNLKLKIKNYIIFPKIADLIWAEIPPEI